tara:strand:- start:74 stop:631 length:558 start_codon:yes stop_codon:yes gene_type:complete
MVLYTSFDFLALGLILFSSVFAYFRGVFREIILISNWFISILISYLISPAVFNFISNIEIVTDIFSDSCELIMILAFLFGFIFSLIIVSFFTLNLSKFVENSIFSEINKVLGLCFGILRGALIIIVFLIVHNQIWSDGGWTTVHNSKSNNITINMQNKVLAHYPKNIPKWLINNYESLVTNCLVR